MSATFELTAERLAWVAKQPAKQKRILMDAIAANEYNKCADDIMYWFDASRHFKSATHPNGTPYVYTQERHPLYECLACGPGMFFPTKRQGIHLQHTHGLEYTRHSEISKMFREVSGKRQFELLCYMPEIIEWWLREPITLWEKSRDMMATWLAVSLFTWDTMFHANRQFCFQSETAVKTNELVERAHFIWGAQPAFLKNFAKAQYNSGTGRAGYLRFPSIGSEIIGLPQGADQIRQYHPSGVFSDEAAFQIEAGAMFTAIKPAIENGGRYTAVSSANPGWFMLATQDKLDD